LADERPAQTVLIFVYGVLMRGFDLHHHMAGAVFEGLGWTSGTLVDLGRYPGLRDGEGRVEGELYRLEDPAASLEALDDVEAFDPADPQNSEYLRVVRDVHALDGTIAPAWVYLYNRATAGLPVVKGGDWRRFTGKR
jgi:gamma-glutamylcyclotransferase (GGCT)/AIG2-like uncharacterized protein YtfP